MPVNGGARQKFSGLWWRAGRWRLISIKTAAEPLTIHRLALDESRYPYENEGVFDAGDAQLPGVVALATRGIQDRNIEYKKMGSGNRSPFSLPPIILSPVFLSPLPVQRRQGA